MGMKGLDLLPKHKDSLLKLVISIEVLDLLLTQEILYLEISMEGLDLLLTTM